MREQMGSLWTSQTCADTLSPFRHAFKRLRTDTAPMAVSTGTIVEGLEVLVDLGRGDLPSPVDALF